MHQIVASHATYFEQVFLMFGMHRLRLWWTTLRIFLISFGVRRMHQYELLARAK